MELIMKKLHLVFGCLTMPRSQLYFDRVHSFAPILHQRRYYSWGQELAKTGSRKSLQYAMWSLAASVSAQFQDVGDSLYWDTRRILDTLEMEDTNVELIDIEQVQAYILLAIYEFMRSDYRRGWMSAGRAFRLIQLMRLHEIDVPSCIPLQVDWVEIEEKRRTFWMAYSLDRFVSIQNGWPLTLSEQVVRWSDCTYVTSLRLGHADHDASSGTRSRISKQPTHCDGISIGSYYRQRSKLHVALHRMHHFSDNQWTSTVAPTSVVGREHLRQCLGGFLEPASVD